ncbi:hypothetical protein AX774_g6207 [Zancudomyces culisetae]|uniref:Uncharacterized protein n=1 Tax=Zancudomyces culisetae TaxID=1213189 RepID=A0A1R1PHA7_ZANCU|nr:hypothetical protein AX774_g6207 [Zancudomyces culisetae]|eukprot:OMH80361.1 hypothetical protein AX774_g6207 [Zancudomyces culisetae]
MYINAIKSYRYNGRGYSQLAIVSTYERDNEMAIYWNCFGVCMQEKRENADKNLSIMAKNYVNTVSVNTCKMRMQHIFLASCFGYLLVNNELPLEQGKEIKKMFENAHSMCESDRRDNVGNGTKYGRYDEFVIAVVVVTMLNETIKKIAIKKDQNQSHQDSYAKVSVMQGMVKLVLGHLKTLFAQMNKEFRAKTEAVLDIQKWSMAAAGLYIDYICYLVDNRLEVIRGDPVSYKCLFPGVQNIIKKFKDNQNQQKVEKTSVIQRDKDGEVSGAVLQPCYHDHLVLGFQFFEQLHSSIILSPLPNDDNNSSNLVDGFIHRSTYALQKLSHCK